MYVYFIEDYINNVETDLSFDLVRVLVYVYKTSIFSIDLLKFWKEFSHGVIKLIKM